MQISFTVRIVGFYLYVCMYVHLYVLIRIDKNNSII